MIAPVRSTLPWLTSVITLVPATASAITEIPGPYDARSIALGGAGVALAENSSAVYHNPAALEQIGRLSATVGIFPWSPRLRAPVAGPGTEIESSGVFPLFFAGVAYRVFDPVVIGLAVYPTGGLGSRYEDVEAFGGADFELGILMLEAAAPVSVRLLPGLSLSIGPRFTFVTQSSKAPMPGTTVVAEQDLSGTHFGGWTVGAHYTPIPQLSLGLSYRSRVTVQTSGTTTMGEQQFDTRSSFAAPHAFRLGILGRLFRDVLRVTVDAKYLLYRESNRSLTTIISTPAGDQATTLALDWDNAVSVNGGIEYLPLQALALRLGYAVSSSATPTSTANPFTTPPSIVQSIHGGVGVRLGDFTIDAGAYYAFSNTDVDSEESPSAGQYSLDGFLGAFSVTYGF